MRRHILCAFTLVLCLSSASATEMSVGPITIEGVSVIGSAFGLHKAGNMEIQTRGMSVAGMACDDSVYITTLQTAGSYDAMLSMLTTAVALRRPVNVRISDDLDLNAYPKRCSLIGVQLLAQ